MNDLIARQAAISAIREMSPELFSAYQHNAYVDKQEVMIRLMALPSSQSEPRWIPVTEDKPRKRSNILVTDFNMVVEAYYDSDGNWLDLLGTELKGVTAWMPTPKPYRKETEDA